MNCLYVESTPQFELEDTIDEIIMNCDRVHDKARKCKYLKVGCGYDIETSKIPTDKGNFAYCYHWQFGLGDYCIMGRHLCTMQSFFNILDKHIKDMYENTQLIILDANLGYEWQFCKHYWKHIGIRDIFAKEKHNPLSITIGDTLYFREIIGLWGKSLAQIAKNWCGVEKLDDFEYDVIRVSSTQMTEKEIAYCIRDVEILVKLGEVMFTMYYGNKKRMPYTATGIVRDEIKKEFGSHLKEWKKKIASWMPDEETYNLFRMYLFKGGISGSNIIHMNKIFEDLVIGDDITSDYPFQMLTEKYPMGKAEECSPKEFLTENKPYIVRVIFKRFRSKNCHALMSCHKALNTRELERDEDTVLDNNRIQYAESVELILNDIEWHSLKKAYKWEHAYIVKCWVFRDGYDYLPIEIRRVVIRWYLKKEALKSQGLEDTIDYRVSKEFVNGIFGMMCTALYLEEYTFLEEECVIGLGEDSRKDYDDCCQLLFLSPYWGFWITSYARRMLMDIICRFPNVIIQYDTDSVYFLDNGTPEAEALKKYIDNFNRVTSMRNRARFVGEERLVSLGTWDSTERFKKFKALGSKRYMYQKKNGSIKVVVTGIRKSKIDGESTLLKMNDYNNEINGTNVDPFDFFTDGMYIDENHSEKLASKYIETPVVVDYNGEKLDIPSCLVLEPVGYKMGLGKRHKSLMLAIHRHMRNTKDGSVYDIWRRIQNGSRLNISTTTPISASTTIGN